MAQVELKNINKIYSGNVHAVKDANIVIEDREFAVLVGPSGCGKTTTLRMIAGLEEISTGEMLIDGKRVNDIPPKDRDIAMVFQNYALYPHMSVYENMAFGLRIRKYSKEVISERVAEAARILDIGALLERKPKALSGGQRQRVAVGRAIVRNPKVFLFDEPLSNLDAKLRVQMRAEISALHNRLNATMIYVTHDQVEAMTMGTKIVVMKDGIVQQIGSPLQLYNQPANRFVAGFIGSPPMNFLTVEIRQENGEVFAKEENFSLQLTGKIKEQASKYIGKHVTIGIRPEDLEYTKAEKQGIHIPANAEIIEPLGSEIHLYINTGAHQMIARIPPTITVAVGDKIFIKPKLERAILFDPETEATVQ